MSVLGHCPEPDDSTGYRRQAVRLADERDSLSAQLDARIEEIVRLEAQLVGAAALALRMFPARSPGIREYADLQD